MSLTITDNNRIVGGNDANGGAGTGGFVGGGVNANLRLDPEKYDTVGALIGQYAKPDVRDQLIKTYGDQGITGFLKLTGAINAAAVQDEVTYFEEGRRHRKIESAAIAAVATPATNDATITLDDGADPMRLFDVVMNVADGEKFLVIGRDSSPAVDELNETVYSAQCLTSASGYADADADLIVLGNMYPQGSDQPTAYYEPQVIRRANPFMIIKDRYEVSGSAATNVGYVNLGNGDYRWYMKGEQDARARFEDYREMMMLFGELAENTTAEIAGSEGYFAAVADRGINVTGLSSAPFSAMSDIDDIIKELDKEGAPAEYAMYLNRTQDLAIDDLLANGIATQVTAGLAGQFGAFNNSADMAVELGFKSFTRGGYTFHKHDWKLLNDPTLLGLATGTGSIQGAMVPMTQVADPRTGTKAPALEMNYKASNGYSRELEHWVTGGGVLGFNNNGDTGKDVATFHYRSEINLITRAANQHVALKG